MDTYPSIASAMLIEMALHYLWSLLRGVCSPTSKDSPSFNNALQSQQESALLNHKHHNGVCLSKHFQSSFESLCMCYVSAFNKRKICMAGGEWLSQGNITPSIVCQAVAFINWSIWNKLSLQIKLFPQSCWNFKTRPWNVCLVPLLYVSISMGELDWLLGNLFTHLALWCFTCQREYCCSYSLIMFIVNHRAPVIGEAKTAWL